MASKLANTTSKIGTDEPIEIKVQWQKKVKIMVPYKPREYQQEVHKNLKDLVS